MPVSDLALTVNVRGTLTKVVDLGGATVPLALGKSIVLANGTQANQADKVYADTNTLAASANTDIDLAGVLTDAVGDPLTFARVKLIVVTADPTNTNNVVVGAAAATQFVGPFGAATHTVSLRPGGVFAVGASDATAWPVGAGASDLLRIANSAGGTSVTYSIFIAGASA